MAVSGPDRSLLGNGLDLKKRLQNVKAVFELGIGPLAARDRDLRPLLQGADRLEHIRRTQADLLMDNGKGNGDRCFIGGCLSPVGIEPAAISLRLYSVGYRSFL